jgi:hypothetical protein
MRLCAMSGREQSQQLTCAVARYSITSAARKSPTIDLLQIGHSGTAKTKLGLFLLSAQRALC